MVKVSRDDLVRMLDNLKKQFEVEKIKLKAQMQVVNALLDLEFDEALYPLKEELLKLRNMIAETPYDVRGLLYLVESIIDTRRKLLDLEWEEQEGGGSNG